jgi:hypothetical protein
MVSQSGYNGCTPKPYQFIGFGDIYGPKPYTCIGFGDIYGPKPYKFIRFGDIHGQSNTTMSLSPGKLCTK